MSHRIRHRHSSPRLAPQRCHTKSGRLPPPPPPPCSAKRGSVSRNSTAPWSPRAQGGSAAKIATHPGVAMQPWLTRRASHLARGSKAILDSRNGGCTLETPRPLAQSGRAARLEASLEELGSRGGWEGSAMATRRRRRLLGIGCRSERRPLLREAASSKLASSGPRVRVGRGGEDGKGERGLGPPGGAWRSSGPDCAVCRHSGRSAGVENTLYSARKPHSVS